MHEWSLLSALIHKIESITYEQQARKVVRVKVLLGALSHISPKHFREHFVLASYGTVAEGARLDIEVQADTSDPHAQEILLDSLEIE
jgi:hydrogenase nickel incorporation protein HypA/HybF